jgi:tetratricopeptide (TPR) repeat protein
MKKLELDSQAKSLLSVLVKAKEIVDKNIAQLPKKQQSEELLSVLNSYKAISNNIGLNNTLCSAIANCYLLLESVATKDEHKAKYFEQAVIWAKKAVEFDPNSASSHAFLGYIFFVANVDYVASADEYRKAISLGSCDASVYVMAASIHFGSPDSPVNIKEVIEWLEKAVQLMPTNPDYHAFLGKVYFENGQVTEAARQWTLSLLSSGSLQKGYLETIKSHC